MPALFCQEKKRGHCDFLTPKRTAMRASLDIFWLRDESFEESDNLPDPAVLAEEIVEDLEAALEQFRQIANDLSKA